MTEKKIITKHEAEAAFKVVQEHAHPDVLRIPKKNPTLNYRWIRRTDDNINLMEAKGYTVANGEQVRAAGIKPSVDGTGRRGDLILAVEDYAHHRDHKQKEQDLKTRQEEMQKAGVKRPIKRAGWEFSESIKES